MKALTKTILFIACCALVFGVMNSVLRPDDGDGTISMAKFYEMEPYSIDVLAIGSSHVFENINPSILWESHGIASYDLCASMQPMWNSYYYLVEALKTQHPKLVVLETFGAVSYDDDYSSSSVVIKNNFGLKPSINKFRSIRDSVPSEELVYYLLQFPTYHTRYAELMRDDFFLMNERAAYRYFLGYGTNFATTPIQLPDVTANKSLRPLLKKSEEFFLKIIELCKERQIPLLLVQTPYAFSNEDQSLVPAPHASEDQLEFNTVAQIAAEKGVPYVNYHLIWDEIGIDPATDFADTHHLNYLGNVKLSQHLAEYIKSNYDIADRRSDERYAYWANSAAFYKRTINNQQIKDCTQIADCLDAIVSPGYKGFLYLPVEKGTATLYSNALQKIGLSDQQCANGGAYYFAYGNPAVAVADDGLAYDVALGKEIYTFDADHVLSTSGRILHTCNTDAITLLLLDDVTETLVDKKEFPIIPAANAE